MSEEVLQPANLLCPANIAVSGHLTAIERLAPAATEGGCDEGHSVGALPEPFTRR